MLPLRSKKLQLIVREPYTPDGSRYQVERALIDPGTKIEALNKMREGYLFLDGPRQPLALEMGQRVSFDLSPEPLCVFGIDRKKLEAT